MAYVPFDQRNKTSGYIPFAQRSGTSAPFVQQNNSFSQSTPAVAQPGTIDTDPFKILPGAGAILESVHQRSPAPVLSYLKNKIGDTFPKTGDSPQEIVQKSQTLAVGFAGGGTGNTVSKLIAASKDPTTIAGLIRKEIPKISDELANGFSQVFKHVNVVDDVQSALEQIRFQVEKFKPQPRAYVPISERATVPTKPSSAKEAIAKGLTEERFVKGQAQKEGIATRFGEIDKNGAYFSTGEKGSYNPNYFNAKTEIGTKNAQYNIQSAKIVKSDTPEARKVLEEALKDTKNTQQQINLLRRELGNPDNLNKSIITWQMNDQIPSIVTSAKKLGYDGIKVIEAGDVSNPTSLFIWNTDKVKLIKNTSQLRAEYQAASGIEIEQTKVLLEIKKSELEANPARQLAKFANKNGELPEVLGRADGKFANTGDVIVTEIGYKDSETARAAYQEYRLEKAAYEAARKEFIASSKSTPELPALQTQAGKPALEKQAVQNQEQTVHNLTNTPEEIQSYNEIVTRQPKNTTEAKEMFDEFNVQNIQEQISPEVKATISSVTEGSSQMKDISGLKGQFRDIYRNLEKILGVEKANPVLKILDDAKAANIDELKQLTSELKKELVDEFGIQKGTKESYAIKEYGEGLKTRSQLIEQFGPETTAKIINAERWFRTKYDEILPRINKVRAQIYPDDISKIIPKRKDYFRSFTDFSDLFEGVKGAFETPAGISSELSGISSGTKPRSKFLSLAQQRFSRYAKGDAIGGYLDYIQSASYAMHIDPTIGVFRHLASSLAGHPTKTKNINNFIEYLHDYADDLAGKSNPADRFIQKLTGRKVFRAIDFMNKRAKANVILGNVSSAIAQIFNVPQGIASAKLYSIPGAAKTLSQIFVHNPAMEGVKWLDERYSHSFFTQFDHGMLQNTKKLAIWVTGVLDEVGTKFIWNSHYSKYISENNIKSINGVAKMSEVNAAKEYASRVTRKLVAGRGIGEAPLIQKSKLFQLVAPFQLEVTNVWHVMGDMVSKRDFSGLVVFFIASYLLNNVIRSIRGSDVGFDPINSTIEGAKLFRDEPSPGVGVTKFLGRQAGEVFSNLPLGQTMAAIYRQRGYFGVSRSELFGQGDPSRFGSGILLTKALSDPLFMLLPPFGGKQIQKSVGGFKAVTEGSVSDSIGRKMFEVGGTLFKNAQTLIFGKYAGSEARDYFDKTGEPKAKKKSESPSSLPKLKSLTPPGLPKLKLPKLRSSNESSQKLAMGDTHPVRDFINTILGVKQADAAAVPTVTVRGGNTVTPQDLYEASAILFGEVSNRSYEKQLLEARTILNTVINRMDQYREHGTEKTLTEVLQAKNQYQAYKGKEYTRYKEWGVKPTDEQKIKAITVALGQLASGELEDNVSGYVYYVHKPDGRIVARAGKLFK